MRRIDQILGVDSNYDGTGHFSKGCGGQFLRWCRHFIDTSFKRLPGVMGVLLLLALGGESVQATPDVTFVDLSNVSSTNTPITFGQVFAPGDISAGLGVVVNVGGSPLSTQVDVKATHPDGSLRHAVVTTWLPALGAGQSLAAEFVTSSSVMEGAAVSAADVLATRFDAVIELTLDGVVYTASARDALLDDSSRRWLEGPLVTEFTLKRPFAAGDGSVHPHLMARFDLRAYQGVERVRVDAIVENNWIYVPDPSNFTYDARVLIGGAEVYSLTELTHYRRARWHKVFWWGNKPDVYVQHDTAYLQQTKAVPHYDPAVSAKESSLVQMGERVYSPMDNVDLQVYMPAAGGDPAIGPLPRWAALYLISGDLRAYRAVLANGDAGGSYSTHFRDQSTDYPVSIDDRPRLGNNSVGADKPAACTETGTGPETWTCRNPYTPDSAHQPSIAYLPYLLTGDHFYLEELLFWATYNFVSMGYSTREEEKGILKGQVRGQAWSLRTLGQTAYILPDTHPMKSYFTEKLSNNRERLMAFYVDNPEANKLGVAHNYQSLADLAKPWMDDFYTWSLAYLTELGFSDFLPVLEWKSTYPIGRMTSADDEYCWIFGAVYTHDLGPDTSLWGGNPDHWFESFSEIYQATYKNWKNDDGSRLLDQPCGGIEMAAWLSEKEDRLYVAGEMYGHASSPLGYPANSQPAMAAMVDAGIPNSDLAWTRLSTSASRPDYSGSPQFAVFPRLLNSQDPRPNVNFSADRVTVASGEQVTLTWQVTEADSCIASGAWAGSKALSGTFDTDPINTTATYTLKCSGTGGETARSVVISLNNPPPPNANSNDKSDSSGGGSWGGFLFLLGGVIAWRRLRKGLTTVRRFSPRALFHAIAVTCVIATVPVQASTPGLVLHWDFDAVADKTVSDLSGLGNHGTSKETPVLNPGKLGQAMTFDDIREDKIGLDIVNFPSEELGLSVWLRSTDSNGGSTILSYRSSDRESNLFELFGVQDLQVLVNGHHVKDIDVAVADGQWHHLVVNWSRRNGVLVLYKNGIEVYRGTDVSRTQAIPSSGKVSVGVDVEKWSTAWGAAYDGDMDDLRIYNRLLSQDEIAWLASATPLDDSQSPAAPSNLQAVAVSPQESYLRWDVPADDHFVAAYRVYRDDILAGTTGDTSFIDEGMTPGTSHNYTVVALDGANNSSVASAAVSVQSPASGDVLDALPPGHWYEIKNSSIWAQLGVKYRVMDPWSGGLYDSNRDRLVVWGGGHLDYDGNELYAFDFDSFNWIQLTQKTPKEQRVKSVDVYDDGLPSSRHTYDGLQYIPTIDSLFTSGGSIWGSGGCSGGTWLYDFSAVPAESGWQNIEDDRGGCGMISAYDSATGHVWYGVGRNLYEFDPLNLSAPWTQRSSTMVSHFYMTGAIDPNRRKLALLGGTGYGGFAKTVIYDITDPEAVTGGVAVTTGATEIENSDAAGFEFDPVSDRFVAWKGGEQVYALASDTLEWSRMLPAATNLIIPSRPAEKGTYGRFRYVPSKNLFVVVNDMQQNVFVYKLSEGSGSARPFPSLGLTASSTTVGVGAMVELTWSTNDADSCIAEGGWTGTKALASSETVGPLSETTRFTLTCSSEVGDAVRSIDVTVSAAVPNVNLSATPASIMVGASTTLNWSSSNADSCTASGAWSGNKDTSGSQLVSPGSSSTYTLSCTGSGGTTSASFEVMVTTVLNNDNDGGGASGPWFLLLLGLFLAWRRRYINMMLKVFFLPLIIVLLSACGGDSTGDGNASPVVNVTIDTDATVGVEVRLSATATDPDRDTLQYAWSITSAPVDSSVALINAGQSTSALTPDIEGDYSIRLTVSDGIHTVTRTGTVQASRANLAPTARIVSPPTALLNSTVSLDGTSSADPNRDTLSYRWIFLSRPTNSLADFSAPNVAQPRFAVDVSGDYQVQLIVNDGELDSTPATATVTVPGESENASPTVNTTINTNATVGVQVSLTATAIDPEKDSLQYLWSITSAPVGSTALLANADQSVSTFIPDLEGHYTVQIVVSDGTNEVTRVSTIQAAQGNIAPTASITPLSVVALNSTVQLDGSNSIDPNNNTLSYRWTLLSRPVGSQAFLNNANIVQPTFTADLGGDYQVQLIVNDGEFDSTPVTATVMASNFSIAISWPANTDNPAGYALYAGAGNDTVDQLLKILVRNATDWDPAVPAVEVGGDTLLNALPIGSTQACFAVRAYNGVGLSVPSEVTCEQLP